MVEKQESTVSQKNKLITIIGPTACGKTGRAVDLAKSLGAEIISADSRQVYKGMDIGTGKDLQTYESIPYHLIDICEAGEKYNLHRYVSDFRQIYKELNRKNTQMILCGGSGMYLETVLSGIELPEVPENSELRYKLQNKTLDELADILKNYKTLHNKTDIDTKKRVIRAIEIEEFYRKNNDLACKADRTKTEKLKSLIIGIDIERGNRRENISRRLLQRLDEGMVTEVEDLLKKGITPEALIYYGLEYKYITLYLIGDISYQDMVNQLEIAIHQFSKRQMTWFRGMEKRGFSIYWLPYELGRDEFVKEVKKLFLSRNPLT